MAVIRRKRHRGSTSSASTTPGGMGMPPYRRVVWSIIITLSLLVVAILLYEIDAGFRAVRDLHTSSKTKRHRAIRRAGQQQQHNYHNAASVDYTRGESEQEQEGEGDQADEQIEKLDNKNNEGEDTNEEDEDEKEEEQEEDEEKPTLIDKEIENQVLKPPIIEMNDSTSLEKKQIQKQKVDDNGGRRYYSIEIANLVGTDNDNDKGTNSDNKVVQEGETNNSNSNNSGTIIIETRPDWAPIGVEHLHMLLDNLFYIDCRFFRVIPNFMVQFGINGQPSLQKQYSGPNNMLVDDPVIESNKRGTISYAMSGNNTRTTQLFINTRQHGNAYLDREGFAPIGQVISGMNYIDLIYSNAREKPIQNMIHQYGNKYLTEQFPQLSYIKNIQQLPGSDPVIQNLLLLLQQQSYQKQNKDIKENTQINNKRKNRTTNKQTNT